ncbi:hypothetical protein J2T57_000606 [Natronocella acetinitrilica]|uniref:Uncharacterized protein n=1 Tax=Natronocella acetinitrilica TaxID=414046 RepID=A0AAE3G1X0_9GAMM|nr:hypothetical protein [Natronocella acetinitrilica]MCP1673514.1 hypothetical protein [Natronocella acetinitrilica]
MTGDHSGERAEAVGKIRLGRRISEDDAAIFFNAALDLDTARSIQSAVRRVLACDREDSIAEGGFVCLLDVDEATADVAWIKPAGWLLLQACFNSERRSELFHALIYGLDA